MGSDVAKLTARAAAAFAAARAAGEVGGGVVPGDGIVAAEVETVGAAEVEPVTVPTHDLGYACLGAGY